MPHSWPNNSLSTRPAEIALQFTLTSGRSLRALRSWTARATSSLPVPSRRKKHGGVRGRDELDLCNISSNEAATADHLLEVVLPADFFLEVDVFLLQTVLRVSTSASAQCNSSSA
jgi:hypothetical protein